MNITTHLGTTPKGLPGWAMFAMDRSYRFELGRTLSEVAENQHVRTCTFIGLNPSTADESQNDNTVERCQNWAINWGFQRFVMLNLFPAVSTDPKKLKELKPLHRLGGKHNLETIISHAFDDRIVLCWGNHADNDPGTALAIILALQQIRKSHRLEQLKCFSITNQRQPIHPLYLPNNSELINFSLA